MRVFRRGVPAVLVILLSVLFLKGSSINVPTGTWQSTATMSSARANAIAVLVPDGRIVIAGGADSTGAPTASAEAFSADGTFSALKDMSTARSQHAAIYTMTGDLLVTGGVTSGGGITNTTEVFDSLTNTWHSLSATMVDARAGHTMTQLQNGNILIAGGENSSGPVAALEIYDITSGQFSFAGTLATARKGHAAAVLNDGRVLIIGGATIQSDGTSSTLASTEIYDPATGHVTDGPSLSTPRTNATATTLLDGRILVVGGSYPEGANGAAPELASAEIYDPVSNTFTASASHLADARTGHLAFLLPNNNNVLILGGTNSQPDSTGTSLVSSPLASAELYTPWTDSFATTAPMSTARDVATGSALNNSDGFGLDGMLLMVGGTNQNSAEVYGFATVKTDAQEYVPGAPVVITGSGWIPGETVQLTLVETPNVDSPSPMTAVADANGSIYNNQFSPDANDAGITFFLTAKGSNSQAVISFRDANKIGSVTATPSNPPEITAGTSQNYNITVNRATGNGTSGAFTANITVSGLPSGAAENPALNIALSSQQSSNSGTLTITTTSAVAPGTYTVTITATNPAVSGDSQTTTVKLNVKNAATSLTVDAVTGVFGGTASLSATLKDVSNNPVQNETISFTLNGNTVGSANTNGSGVATLSNVSLAGIIVGTHAGYIGASFAGDGSYSASNGTADLAINQATQSLSWIVAPPATATYNTTFPVTATATSGLTPTYNATGSCSIAGNTVTMNSGIGSCTVTADQAGNTNYSAATQLSSSVTAQKADQTITVTTPAPASAVFNTQFTVAATASSSLSVSYTSAGACSNTAATYTMTSGTGLCTVKYDQAGDNNYNPAPEVTASVTAEKANQTITVTTPAPASAVYNTNFTVAATASSSLLVSYTSAGVCSNTSAIYTMTSGTGTCTVKYDQAGNDNYNAATQVTEAVTAQKANQAALTLTSTSPLTYNQSETLSVTGGTTSGAVTYNLVSGPCAIAGNQLTANSGTGSCSVTATMAGNDNYNDVTSNPANTVTLQKANQAALMLNSTSPLTFNQSETLSVTGGTTSGAVTYNLVSGPCAITGSQLTANSGTGSCSVTATMAGNDNYNDVTSNPANSITLQKANQAELTLNSTSPLTFDQSETLSVTGGTTNGAVTYNLVSGPCTIVGTQLTANSGTGSCSVTATMAGNDNYKDVTSNPANTVTLQKADQTITVATHAPVSAVYNTSFDVVATASSGLTVAYTSTGVCTTPGPHYTMTSGTGICTVQYNQTGNDNYNAAPQLTDSVTALKADQTITVTTHAPVNAVYNTSFDVLATASSGLAIAYTSTGVCTTPGPHYTMSSGTGTCTVKYNQAGNDNYNAAPQLTDSVTAQKANLTITPNSPLSIVLHQPTTSLSGTVTSSVPAPLAGLNISVSLNGVTQSAAADSSGMFTSSFNTVSLAISAGYPVSYSFAGDANFNPAGPVNGSLAVRYGTAIGFFQPWAPAPGAAFKAGSTIPLKWQWTDFNGNVVDSGSVVPFVQSNAYCASSATSDVISLETAGNSGYQYDPTTFTWQFNWKTAKNAAGQCFMLNVGYNNGLANGLPIDRPTQLK